MKYFGISNYLLDRNWTNLKHNMTKNRAKRENSCSSILKSIELYLAIEQKKRQLREQVRRVSMAYMIIPEGKTI